MRIFKSKFVRDGGRLRRRRWRDALGRRTKATVMSVDALNGIQREAMGAWLPYLKTPADEDLRAASLQREAELRSISRSSAQPRRTRPSTPRWASCCIALLRLIRRGSR